MRRGAWRCGFWLVLGLALACEDENEQRFPFSYDALEDEAAPTAPAAEAPAEGDEDLVLVDAGLDDAGPDDAELVDAALEEPVDAAEGDDLGDPADGDDDAGDPLEESLDDPLDDSLEEGAGGTRDDELFGGEDGDDTTPTATDGGALPPGQGLPPGARRGPVTFPPIPPGGVPGMSSLPLYPGETFDVATLAGGYSAVVMKNVALRLDEDVNLFVVSLSGALVPVATGLVDLDRPGDLQLVIDEAEVRVSEEDLARIFERYLFEEEDAFGDDFGGGVESPLRDVEVSLERGRVVLKAELEDGGDDVEIRGTLEPTVSGDVAFIPTSLRRDDKPVDTLEDIFDEGVGAGFGGGDELRGGAASLNAGPAVWLDEDALYFDPEAIVTAPALDADVIDVRTSGKHVRLLLEGNAPEVKTLGPAGGVENYVELRGGAVRFGKVIMPRADILFLDADEGDPLDLSLHRFDEQVIAGETRMRPDLGLEATLPDFDEIPESAFEVPDDDGDGGALDEEDGDGGLDDGGELDEGDGGEANGSGRDDEVFE